MYSIKEQQLCLTESMLAVQSEYRVQRGQTTAGRADKNAELRLLREKRTLVWGFFPLAHSMGEVCMSAATDAIREVKGRCGE